MCKTKNFCLGCQFQKRSRVFSNHMQLSPVVHYCSQQSCCCVERELKLYPGTAARHAAILVLIKRILPYISIAWTALSFYVFLKDVHMNKRKVWTPMTATRSCGCCFFFFNPANDCIFCPPVSSLFLYIMLTTVCYSAQRAEWLPYSYSVNDVPAARVLFLSLTWLWLQPLSDKWAWVSVVTCWIGSDQASIPLCFCIISSFYNQ